MINLWMMFQILEDLSDTWMMVCNLNDVWGRNSSVGGVLGSLSCVMQRLFFFFFFFCVPQLYLWGSPLLGEIFAYVTVFLI